MQLLEPVVAWGRARGVCGLQPSSECSLGAQSHCHQVQALVQQLHAQMRSMQLCLICHVWLWTVTQPRVPFWNLIQLRSATGTTVPLHAQHLLQPAQLCLIQHECLWSATHPRVVYLSSRLLSTGTGTTARITRGHCSLDAQALLHHLMHSTSCSQCSLV